MLLKFRLDGMQVQKEGAAERGNPVGKIKFSVSFINFLYLNNVTSETSVTLNQPNACYGASLAKIILQPHSWVSTKVAAVQRTTLNQRNNGAKLIHVLEKWLKPLLFLYALHEPLLCKCDSLKTFLISGWRFKPLKSLSERILHVVTIEEFLMIFCSPSED